MSVFVTGTSTEVGKSVVAAVIAHTAAAAGRAVAVFKPAVTGLDDLNVQRLLTAIRHASGKQARNRPGNSGYR